MSKRLAGLLVGPLALIALGLIFFGSAGVLIGFFVLGAAVVFIPTFGLLAALVGSSLLALIAAANVVPLGFYILNCAGHACPNYTLAAVAPQYLAATFCAVVYWLVNNCW